MMTKTNRDGVLVVDDYPAEGATIDGLFATGCAAVELTLIGERALIDALKAAGFVYAPATGRGPHVFAHEDGRRVTLTHHPRFPRMGALERPA